MTFFSYQSKTDYLIESSDTADFFVNRKYTLEIGGKIQFHYDCSVSSTEKMARRLDLWKKIPGYGTVRRDNEAVFYKPGNFSN